MFFCNYFSGMCLDLNERESHKLNNIDCVVLNIVLRCATPSSSERHNVVDALENDGTTGNQ